MQSRIPREYYLNADFDSGLLGRPSLLETGDPTFLHEMAWHFLFAPGPGDSLIVHRDLPADFLAYLDSKGLRPPRLTLHPGFTPDSIFTPFGWNSHTESMSSRYKAVAPHPALEAVKLANSRTFSLELERLHAEDDGSRDPEPATYGNLFVSLEALEGFLASRHESLGWVVKGEHGHAGTANRRVPSGPLGAEDRRILAGILADHGRVAVEPWHDRVLDMSVNFRVAAGGAMSGYRGHLLLNSRDGAFLGVKILPSRRPPEPWDGALEASAAALARALDAIGYHGPVGVDAYVWNSPQGPRLRSMVDINARLSMALPAHGLADRLPGKTLLWMWTKPRKLDLPDGYGDLDARLGPDAFRSETGTGILAASPLIVPVADSRKVPVQRPKRVGFLFSAVDEDGLAGLQAAFSRALGRA
ncbi:MAG: hypothetical protein JWP91_1295 [Fibrobacteres bacterium]|nr:hypothetical protein [Fibrobacterota bacterium]